MINVKSVKCYCKNYTEIENYDKAIADTTQVWHCHHILEQFFTRTQLLAGGNYYNVEPECLIFLTPSEHNKIPHKGKKLTDEQKKKISERLKGNQYTKGKHFVCSEETRKKLSECFKGRIVGRHYVIRVVETGEIFQSIRAACRKYGKHCFERNKLHYERV